MACPVSYVSPTPSRWNLSKLKGHHPVLSLRRSPQSVYRNISDVFPPLSPLPEQVFDDALKTRPTVLYLHGNVSRGGRTDLRCWIAAESLRIRLQHEPYPIELGRYVTFQPYLTGETSLDILVRLNSLLTSSRIATSSPLTTAVLPTRQGLRPSMVS